MNRILSLSGLKILVLLPIVWLHCFPPRHDLLVGWAGMHFFFCVSGFLIGVRYWQKENWEGLGTAWNYLRGKVLVVWPLYVLSLVVCYLLQGERTVRGIQDLICAGLFLHAWGVMRLSFSLHGASWFLSALMFCYLMAPIYMYFIRRVRAPWLAFLFFFVQLYVLERLNFQFKGEYFDINFYTNPYYRSLEFALAMCIYPMAGGVIDRLRSLPRTKLSAFVSSLSEVLCIGGVVMGVWLKPHFMGYLTWIMVMVVTIVVIALERGACSTLLSKWPLRWLAACELEVYLLHIPVIMAMGKVLPDCGRITMGVSVLVMTVVLSCLWRRWVAASARRAFTCVVERGEAFLCKRACREQGGGNER